MSAVGISATQRCQATVVANAVRGKGPGVKEAGTRRGPAMPVDVGIDCFESAFYLQEKEMLVSIRQASGSAKQGFHNKFTETVLTGG